MQDDTTNISMKTMATQHSSRHVSRLTRDTLALIMAGGQGTRLHELTEWRAKPSLQFGGKFRVIDFPLSNCINSGIRRIGVLTQYKAHSLIRHLVNGWTNFRAENKEFVEILPASQRVGGEWYRGTADAVYQNIDIIRTHEPAYVLVLAGDHIYKMDYGPLLTAHAERNADLTICCIPVPVEEAAGALGVVSIDENSRIIAFDEKPENPTPIPGQHKLCLASMGSYVFNTHFLFEQVIKDADTPGTDHDFGKNVIPSVIENYNVCAYQFVDVKTGGKPYWRDVGTLDAYWEANMELVSITPELNMYDQDWPVFTYQAQLPPAKFVFDNEDRRGEAIDSLVSGGCVISGSRVKRSMLYSNCRVHSYSTVTDSLLLPDVEVHRHCRIHKAIIDRGCRIDEHSVIGENREDDVARGFRVTESGITLVTPDMLSQDLHYTR